MGDSCDSDAITLPPTPHKRKPNLGIEKWDPGFKISSQTFVTFHATKENHQWKFQILPLARWEKFASGFGHDKLSESIKAGGGLVTVGNGVEEGNAHTVKILDLDYARENIHNTAVQDMLLPYDCFSSNFIWSQIYQRLRENHGYVDLNAYRITPTAYKEFDANAVVKGLVSWTTIPSLPPEKLVSPIAMKFVALFMFSDLLLQLPEKQPKLTRRIYSRKDSQLLLDKVCELQGHTRVHGMTLYKEMACDNFADRNWQSLREHFRKTILPHVLANDGYYVLSSIDFTMFQARSEKRKAKPASEEKR